MTCLPFLFVCKLVTLFGSNVYAVLLFFQVFLVITVGRVIDVDFAHAVLDQVSFFVLFCKWNRMFIHNMELGTQDCNAFAGLCNTGKPC